MGLKFVSLHLLSIMGMLGVRVDLEFLEDLAAEAVVGNHAANRALDEKFGPARPDFGDGLSLLPAHVAGVTGVNFGILLVTGEANFTCVDNHDKIAAIHMGGKNRFALAAKQVGGGDSDGTKDFAIGIDDVPLAFNFFGFCRKGLHFPDQ